MDKNKTQKQIIGQKGEDEAAKYLTKAGFTIIDRNYRKPWGELDLIAKKGDKLYFVEVKTVTRDTFLLGDYEPEDNIHPWKVKRLSRAIETYVLAKGVADEAEWQIDAISVYFDREGSLLKIERLEDIF